MIKLKLPFSFISYFRSDEKPTENFIFFADLNFNEFIRAKM